MELIDSQKLPLVDGLRTVYDDFNHIVSVHADKTAISGQSTSLTYQAVKKMALQCEYAIRHHPGLDFAPIVVCLDGDIRLFALFLGIMKSGRAYFYIDPTDPPAIKQALIDKIRPSLVIGETIQSSSLLSYLDLETIFAVDDSWLSNFDYRDADAMAPCCLVQTSGTTNQARARSISHMALRHNIRNYRNTLNINTNDRLSLLTSPKFGAANSAIYGAFLSGACLCPFSMKAQGLMELVKWISDEKITILHLTPSLFRLLLDYVPAYSLPSIRAIKLGGESLYPADVALFKSKFSPGCVLINGLGMSEIGGNVSFFIMHQDTHLLPDTRIVPVGAVLDGHEVSIVDEKGHLLEGGNTGEIVIRSAFLSKEYLKDDVDQKRQFRNDEALCTRELHTNDFGYFLPNGDLVHLGRKNRLIKWHGFRVDLNVIESTLIQFEIIKNAAAYVSPLGGPRELLVVCVQLVKKNSVDSHYIRQALENVLPAYMVPQLIFFIDAFPLTGSGKIDHQHVLDFLIGAQKCAGGVKPRDALEQQLVKLWQIIFKRDDIGIYDDFYEVGGDSLLAMEFIARLSLDHDIDYSIRNVILNPTIAQIAEDINKSRSTSRVQRHQILQVTLQRIQDKGGRNDLSPLVFLPGGAMSEKELLLVAGLLPYLKPGYSTFGIRLNFPEKNNQLPNSVAAIAAVIANCITDQFKGDLPILIGECIACTLTLEVARQLSKKTGDFPYLILLNPWHPRLIDKQLIDINQHPLEKYYRLLKLDDPEHYAGSINLVLAQNQQRTIADCMDWWRKRTKIEGKVHIVPGDNQSYIRLNRHDLAQTINAICNVKACQGTPFVPLT